MTIDPRILLFSCVLLSATMIGCAKPAGVVFPPVSNAPVFPPPPERARVRYVGQLQTSADLKPAVSFGEQMGGAMFGKGQTFSMLSPYALCTDDADRLFVADSNAQVVHVFDLNTRRYAQIRPNTPQKRFAQPVGIAFDPVGGKLFVADSAAGRIFVFDRAGRPIGEIGAGVVQRPCGMAYDTQRQRLLVADTGLHQVVILSPDGSLLAKLGSRGMALNQFNYPTNVALDSTGRIYVSDSLNFRVLQFSAEFNAIRQIGRKGDMPGYFGQPKGVALDGDDHLYVVDANFEAVQIFDADGILLLDFGTEGRGPGEFWLPAGIFIDRRNRIWVADTYNRRVQVFDYLPEPTSQRTPERKAERNAEGKP